MSAREEAMQIVREEWHRVVREFALRPGTPAEALTARVLERLAALALPTASGEVGPVDVDAMAAAVILEIEAAIGQVKTISIARKIEVIVTAKLAAARAEAAAEARKGIVEWMRTQPIIFAEIESDVIAAAIERGDDQP